MSGAGDVTERPLVDRWDTPFGRWVRDYSVDRLVRELQRRGHRVTAPAVYSWVRGAHQPKPAIGMEIVRLADGYLGFNDVYGHRDLIVREEEPGPDP